MVRSGVPRWLIGLSSVFAVAVVALGSRTSLAQSSGSATAQALFEQGKELLRAGKAAEACPKLAESERIEPSTGTLLALAMCHEADGKLASAWAEFVSVEARARGENRADREQAAHEHAQALRPRLSTLEVRVPSEVASLPGLEIRRDGALLGQGAWNVAVPVDGAEHAVEVSAPGKATWKGTVTVKPASDVAVLTVPALSDAPAAPASNASNASQGPGNAITAPPSGSAEPKRWGALEYAGVSAAGAGVVALGFGGYFLSSALGKKSDSSKDCSGDACGPQGFSDRTSAVSKGNTATTFGIAGGVLVAGGATLLKPRRADRDFSAGAPPAVAALRMEPLTLWVIKRVEAFPRAHRFTVGERWIETCLDVQTGLVEASYVRDKRGLLLAASRGLVRGRVLARLAASLAAPELTLASMSSSAEIVRS